MGDHKDYKAYVTDTRWFETYSAYQARYRAEPRESDKTSARLTLRALREMQPLGRAPRILDIGCSTGNFLLHLQSVAPGAELVGGDLMAPVIDQCMSDPALAEMSFEVMDILNLRPAADFDVIVANAVSVYFEPDEYAQAWRSIAGALRPGGAFVAYEWAFPGAREQRVVETSIGHPEGLKFWLRSENFVRAVAEGAGFVETDITPFEIPIDLPEPEKTGTDADLATFTRIDPVTNRRLMFRGALYQPWAHIVARKSVGHQAATSTATRTEG